MRHGRYRVLNFAVALTLGLVPGLQANPLRAPRRLVNGQTVNLTPLFSWWTNHSGARPLTAWVHVGGRVVGTNTSGWIVEARVKGAAASTHPDSLSDRVLLRNPPLADRAEFERLSAQLKALNQQRAELANEENAAHHRATEILHKEANYRERRLRNRNLEREEQALKASEKRTKTELKLLDQQLKDVKKQLAAYPNPDRYELDCFALDTGQKYERVPIYDFGVPLK